MPHVDLNETNERHCRCPQCPVELNSNCSLQKLDQFEANTGLGNDPSPEEIPEVYCSVGKSTCRDMNASLGCLCPGCLVWDENNLNNNHYCVRGNAEQID